MWKVRAEIIGEFVVVDTYRSFEDACDRYDEFKECGWYDDVDMWKVED